MTFDFKISTNLVSVRKFLKANFQYAMTRMNIIKQFFILDLLNVNKYHSVLRVGGKIDVFYLRVSLVKCVWSGIK